MDARQKKILVPMDFSPASIEAMNLALEFARLHESELILLHIAETHSAFFDLFYSDEAEEKAHKAATKKMNALIKGLADSGVSVSQMFSKGKAYKKIIQTANELMVELILMGSHGNEEYSRGFIGSNTNKVIRSVDCPVIVTGLKQSPTQINKILLPVDPDFGIRELRAWLQEYASRYNPEVEIVSVWREADDMTRAELGLYLQKQEATLRKQGLHHVTTRVLEGGFISEAILNYANENGFDLIAMETHGRKGLSGLLLGSVTEEVLGHSRLPVLSLKPERETIHTTYYHSNLPI